MITGRILRDAILSGANNISNQRSRVDELNVFPVPDGDTGTNMSMTVGAARPELEAMSDDCTVGEAAKAAAGAMLRGARGNSGVITSLLFRGFSKALDGKKTADAADVVAALQKGVEAAYKAVMKPTEGTMLTVARLMSEFARSSASKYRDFKVFLTDVIAKGEEALAKTPELLPVLKKAGVVDSGGMGLLCVYRGFLSAASGEEVEGASDYDPSQSAEEDVFGDNSDIINLDLGEIEFAYCTEFFVINLKKSTTLADIDRLKEKLMRIGDSVICIGDLELVKVHVHTNTPGLALQYAVELGELDRVKIENMLEQNRALRAKREAEKKEMGMLAICTGEGIAAIFKDLLVDRVIEGGQTMNPSASDIASAVQKINAEHVFVFPNNKNIILAAEQAKALVEKRTIHVIPTKNVPQGFAAALVFNPDVTVEENKINMIHAIDGVASGQVTYAVRNTTMNGFKLEEGDIIGLDSKKILAKGSDIGETTLQLIKKMKRDEHEMITLYYGEGVEEADCEALAAKVAEEFPDCDVDYHYGGQPVYYYMVSLE